MTEDEAKQKWCPQYQVSGSDDDDNRSTGWDQNEKAYRQTLKNAFCLGSRCMAWRWVPLQADDAFKNAIIKAAADIGDTSPNKMKATNHVIANRAAYGLPTQPFDGYCGLAGKP